MLKNKEIILEALEDYRELFKKLISIDNNIFNKYDEEEIQKLKDIDLAIEEVEKL